MNAGATLACTICGEAIHGRSSRYLLMEDSWLDTLKIFHWDDELATRCDVHCVCSPAHLQELVVHWMTTGSLHHPFARAFAPAFLHSFAHPGNRALAWGAHSANHAGAAQRAGQIGELALHRESMQRVLDENPQLLRTILDSLRDALRGDTARLEARKSEEIETTAVRI